MVGKMKKFEDISIKKLKKIYKKYMELRKFSTTLKPQKIKKERN